MKGISQVAVIAISITILLSACNPYACLSEYRFAEYKGQLGLDGSLEGEVDIRNPGRIYVSLDQTKGSGSSRQVSVSLNVWGFADSVDVIHIHEGSGSREGRLLYSTSAGYLVRDSVWNGYPQEYLGPVSWEDFWDTLEDETAYLELHPANGRQPVRGRLTLSRKRGYQPGCT